MFDPVVVAVMDPSLPRRRDQRHDIFCGKCPTVCSQSFYYNDCVTVTRVTHLPLAREVLPVFRAPHVLVYVIRV